MSTRLVSVIIPTYNAAAYLGAAIRSVLTQSYSALELIVVDDASDDATPKVIRQFQHDPRLIYERLTKRVSVAATRNVGLKVARGQFVAFLDADDIWLPGKLQRQITMMETQRIDFSFGYYVVVDRQGRELNRLTELPLKVSYRQLLKTNSIPLLTVVLRRQLLTVDGFPDCPDEDYALWLSLLRPGRVAIGLPWFLGQYRLHPDSVSGNKWRASRWVWMIYRQREHLSVVRSAWNWLWYVYYGLKKHRRMRLGA